MPHIRAYQSTELRDGIVNVLHAEEYPRLDFNEMIDTTVKLLEEYDIHGLKDGLVNTLLSNTPLNINQK